MAHPSASSLLIHLVMMTGSEHQTQLESDIHESHSVLEPQSQLIRETNKTRIITALISMLTRCVASQKWLEHMSRCYQCSQLQTIFVLPAVVVRLSHRITGKLYFISMLKSVISS